MTALRAVPCLVPPADPLHWHLAVRRSRRLLSLADGKGRGCRITQSLSSLQCDDVASGLAPSQAVLGELKPPQRENLTVFLRLVGCSVQDGRPGPVSDQQLFSAAYILVSALAGTAQGSRCGTLVTVAHGAPSAQRSAESLWSHRAEQGGQATLRSGQSPPFLREDCLQEPALLWQPLWLWGSGPSDPLQTASRAIVHEGRVAVERVHSCGEQWPLPPSAQSGKTLSWSPQPMQGSSLHHSSRAQEFPGFKELQKSVPLPGPCADEPYITCEGLI